MVDTVKAIHARVFTYPTLNSLISLNLKEWKITLLMFRFITVFGFRTLSFKRKTLSFHLLPHDPPPFFFPEKQLCW